MGQLHMREQLLRAMLAHAQGEIEKHKANVNVYLEHPAGIGEHSDIIEAMDKEIEHIDKYDARLSMILKYLERKSNVQEEEKKSKSK